MKILYIHIVPASDQRTNVLQVIQMCRAFHKIGVDVTLALPEESNSNHKSAISEVIIKKLGMKPEFKIITFRPSVIVNRPKGLSAYCGARSLLRQYHEVDFCFVRSLFMVRLALRYGHKIIYESHQSDLNSRSRLVNLIYKQSILKDAQAKNLILFIAISHALADIWAKRGVSRNKMVALHDGFSEEDFRCVINQEDARKILTIVTKRKIVVYAGSLYEDRNIETIIRLARQFRDVLFYVIGGPEKEKQYYESLAIRPKLNNLFFTGYVPYHQVKYFLYAADVLLMLWSYNVPTIHICSPLKVFEYMAAERVIVGHGFPTIKEVLTDRYTALLSDPNSYEELERKLQYALSLNGPIKLAKNARRVALNQYSWEKRAAKIREVLES